MKGSDRTNVAGSVFASYRNNKFKFRNELSVNMNKSETLLMVRLQNIQN